MKYPNEPYEPFPPEEPNRYLDKIAEIKSIAINDVTDYFYSPTYRISLSSILEKLNSLPKDKELFIGIKKESSYNYDDEETDFFLSILENQKIEDPKYEQNMKNFIKAQEKYKKELASFKDKQKIFKKELAKYNEWKQEEDIKYMEKKLQALKEQKAKKEKAIKVAEDKLRSLNIKE
jgi:hypothetical protein